MTTPRISRADSADAVALYRVVGRRPFHSADVTTTIAKGLLQRWHYSGGVEVVGSTSRKARYGKGGPQRIHIWRINPAVVPQIEAWAKEGGV